MQKTMSIKKFLICQVIIIMIFTMISNIFASKVIGYTVTHNQTRNLGIDAFPDSYKEGLKKLQEIHPNWTFTAYNTDMTWNEFMNAEKVDKKNTISSSNPLWKAPCGHNAGGSFYCASSAIIEYFADPRNFLTEDRNISIYGDVI